MANTIVGPLDGFIHLTAIDSDWNFNGNFPEHAHDGLDVDWMLFSPAAATDKCVIMNRSDAGVRIFQSDRGERQLIYYNGKRIFPYLDFSAGTFNASAVLIIKLR